MARKSPEFWAGFLGYAMNNIDQFPDRFRAQQLIQEGASAFERRDTQALQSVCQQLMQMLPQTGMDPAMQQMFAMMLQQTMMQPAAAPNPGMQPPVTQAAPPQASSRPASFSFGEMDEVQVRTRPSRAMALRLVTWRVTGDLDCHG